MSKPIEREKAIGMMISVCSRYVNPREIFEIFSKEYKDKEEFTPEEMKEICRLLTQNRPKKPTKSFRQIYCENGGITHKKNDKDECR